MEEVGVDGRIRLKWIFNKWNGKHKTRLFWLRTRDRWRALVNAVKGGEILD